MSVSLSTFTEVALVNTTSASGIIVVPPANSIPYRVVVFKDRLGTFQTNSLTLSTQGGNTFEDGTTTKIINNRFGFISLYSDGVSKWHTLNGSQLAAMNISSLIVSTIQGNGSQLTNLNAISSLSLLSSLAGLGSLGYVSTASLTSTVQGLGSANYVSTLSLVSTTQGLQTGYATAGFLSTANLTSTVQGLGSANYISSSQLVSTTQGLTTYISSFIDPTELASTVIGLGTTGFISSIGLDAKLASTTQGLGTAGYISSSQLISTVAGLNTYASSFIDTTELNSTVQGLGSANYVSSLSLVSTTQGLQRGYQTAGFLSTANLTSTVQGLGSANYVSTLSLVSTTQGLQTGYATAGFLSTANLTSTVQGLGSANYVSTLSLVSTTAGILANVSVTGVLSTANLTSTVAGLGTAGYVSTSALGAYFSSVSTSYALNFITSSLTFSTATGSNATISSVTANQFTVGTNGGWLLTGALQTAVVSSIQINTNLLYANSNFFGTVSSQTALQFYGLQGNYNNTVIAEQSTGTGTQELLLFKGSSASDQVRIQTTGGFRLETGVSSRLWPTYAQPANPALYVDINSNVGIGTASPGALLDVVGQGRFQVVSTLQLNISSINGATFGSPINSTVIGLGTSGYVSTLSLVSTTQGLQIGYQTAGFLSTANLTSTVQGLGSASYISTLSLTSTALGLGTLGYISSLSSLRYSTGTLSLSSLILQDGNNSNRNTLQVSSGVLLFNTSTLIGLYASSYVCQGRLTADQTIVPAADRTITFAVDFDPQNWYNTGTYRFAPTIAGYYYMSFGVWWNTGSSANQDNVQMRKNGNTVMILQTPIQTASGLSAAGTKLVYLNGTSDYVDFTAFSGNATNQLLQYGGSAAGSGTWFSAYLLTGGGGGSGGGGQVNTSTISEQNLTSTVVGLGTVGYISTTQLISTTAGILGSVVISGVLSTANLTSTVQGLGSANYISSSQLISTTQGLTTYISSFIDPTELASTVIGLGTAGFISSIGLDAKLASTTQGLGTAGYISSSQLISTVAGLNTYASSFIDTSELNSTVQSLGTLGYISTLSLVSTTQGLQRGYATAGFLSTANLTSTVEGLGSAAYISSSQLQSTSIGLNNKINSISTTTSLSPSAYVIQGSVPTDQTIIPATDIILGFTVTGTPTNTSNYDPQNWWNPTTSTVIPTVAGYYLTSLSVWWAPAVTPNQASNNAQLNIQIRRNGNQMAISQVAQLSTSGAGTSMSLTALVQMNGISDYLSFSAYNGISGYNQQVRPNGTFFNTSLILSGDTNYTAGFISTATLNSALASTTQGLGTAGYISSSQLISTVAGLNSYASSFIDTTELNSTVQGLGSANYVSTLSLVSTTQGLQRGYATAGFLSTANEVSTVQGLGSSGYVSTLSLVSTTQGLQTAYATAGFLSTANLTSTVQGLGSANYVSTLSLVSTTAGILANVSVTGVLSTANLTSTVAGLGTAGYVSTTALGAYFSSVSTSYALNFITSSLTFSTATGSTATISSLTVNQLTFGAGSGWVQFGAVQAVALSSIQLNTNSLYANSNFFGTVSSQTALQFYGLLGNYNNTVIAEQSTGTGTQELLLFKGSSASDQVRIQTTGGFRLETGVSSRLWPTNLQAANPAVYVDINSNVGIGTASPAALLDVVGQGRFQVVSTLQLNISSINGATFGSPINSTVIGLGSAGYVSTLSLVSTTAGILANVSVTGVLSTANLTSTVQGLGTAGYISSSQLVSTTQGLTNYISTFIDPTELASTVIGLGSVGFISSIGLDAKLASTTQGLGTAGYISSSQLISTVAGLNTYTSSFIDTAELNSTVQGLGSANYVSTLSLVSTTASLANTIGFGLSTLSTAIQTSPGYTAQILYLNESVTVAPYKQLGVYQVVAPIQSTITSLPGNTTSNLIAAFQTDFPLPFFIPAGIWDLNIFAEAGGPGVVTFFYNVYSRNGGGSETLLFASEPALVGRTGIYQYTASAPVSYTNIAAGDTLVLKLYGSNSASPTRTFSNYYQNIYYSHIHTTFSQQQETGSSGVSSLSTTVSYGLSSVAMFTSNTSNYFSSQIVSTNNNLISTVAGLGSSGYVSTLSLVSTTQALQNSYATAGFLSTANLTSTVQGLGSAGYVSSSALGAYFSSVSTSYALNFITSSLTFSTATGSNATISTITTNQVGIGSNGGWLQTGALQAIAVSSIQLNTNILYANSNFFGTVSSQTALQFYGLLGNYNNTVIAEQSTGTGTQELLLFKGSSASDQVRIQTTGGFRLETGVSSRLWPTNLQVANPALYVDINSNVGIGTASPAALLDVVGQGRFQSLSTQNINVSTINGASFGAPINSTVIGLGSAGYVSTLSLVSTTAGILATVSITGVISTPNLTSTVQGLGSANYISSSQLISTVAGLNTYTSSFIDTVELTSTVQGLGTSGYISSFQNILSISSQQIVASSIGIGCNAPFYRLDINGSAHATVFSSVSLLTSSFFGTLADATTVVVYDV